MLVCADRGVGRVGRAEWAEIGAAIASRIEEHCPTHVEINVKAESVEESLGRVSNGGRCEEVPGYIEINEWEAAVETLFPFIWV